MLGSTSFCGLWWVTGGWEGIGRPRATISTDWLGTAFWVTQGFCFLSIIPPTVRNTPSLVVGSWPGQTFELNHYYTVTWNCWRPNFLTEVVNQVWMMLNWRLGDLISAFSQDPNQVGPFRINKFRRLLWVWGPCFPSNSFIFVVPAYLEAGNTNIPAKLLNDVVH